MSLVGFVLSCIAKRLLVLQVDAVMKNAVKGIRYDTIFRSDKPCK